MRYVQYPYWLLLQCLSRRGLRQKQFAAIRIVRQRELTGMGIQSTEHPADTLFVIRQGAAGQVSISIKGLLMPAVEITVTIMGLAGIITKDIF